MKSSTFSVPLKPEQDPKKMMLAASFLVSENPRCLEVFWDSTKEELTFLLTSVKDEDHSRFAKMFGNQFGVQVDAAADSSVGPSGTEPSGVGVSGRDARSAFIPEWLRQEGCLTDLGSASFFNISTTHGHAFASYDLRSIGSVMTPLISSLQHARFAWLQVEWYEKNLTSYFTSLADRLNRRVKEIQAPIPKSSTWTDSAGKLHVDNWEEDHWEKGYELDNGYKRLMAHLSTKRGQKQVCVIVRGVTVPQVQVDQSVGVEASSEVEMKEREMELPVSVSSEATIQERWNVYYSNDPRMLVDLVERRTIEPDRAMEEYVGSYLKGGRNSRGSGWAARKGARRNLPFLVLSPRELALILHLPDPVQLKGVRTTRGDQRSLRKLRQEPKEGPRLWDA